MITITSKCIMLSKVLDSWPSCYTATPTHQLTSHQDHSMSLYRFLNPMFIHSFLPALQSSTNYSSYISPFLCLYLLPSPLPPPPLSPSLRSHSHSSTRAKSTSSSSTSASNFFKALTRSSSSSSTNLLRTS